MILDKIHIRVGGDIISVCVSDIGLAGTEIDVMCSRLCAGYPS